MSGRVLAVLVGLVAACSSGPDRETALVRDSKQIHEDRVLRPVHVEPALPGTFAERAEPALRELHGRLVEAPPLQRRTPREVVSDVLMPHASVPPEWDVELARSRTAMQTILEATTAESGRMPAAYQIFEVLQSDETLTLIQPQMVAKLAALEAQHLLESGRADDAVPLCANALALGRDVAAPSLIGQMIGVSIVGIIGPTCLAVAREASPAARDSLVRQVQAIDAAWPKFEATLVRERVFGPALAGRPRRSEARGPAATGAHVCRARARAAGGGVEVASHMALRRHGDAAALRGDRSGHRRAAAPTGRGRPDHHRGERAELDLDAGVRRRHGLHLDPLSPYDPGGPRAIHAVPDGERTEADLDLVFPPADR